jgi:uncharacterized membrane protein YidH (DUF202 family)
VPGQLPGKPGLQAERTQLSWQRSAIGCLASGAIPLLRQGGPLAVGGTLLAVTAVLLALLVLQLGRRRGQQIKAIRRIGGKNIVPNGRTEVLLIGWATASLATAIVVLLLSSR